MVEEKSWQRSLWKPCKALVSSRVSVHSSGALRFQQPAVGKSNCKEIWEGSQSWAPQHYCPSDCPVPGIESDSKKEIDLLSSDMLRGLLLRGSDDELSLLTQAGVWHDWITAVTTS